MTVSITSYAQNSIIPAKVFRQLKDKGFIHDPLTPDDLIGLQLLEKVWGKREVLRPQLVRFSMADRRRFIETADLPTKWERYAYSRFRNQKTGQILPMKTMVEEIENVFGFTPDGSHMDRLHKVRNRAQVARHREKSLSAEKGKTSYSAEIKK